jgi:hypothetical protein
VAATGLRRWILEPESTTISTPSRLFNCNCNCDNQVSRPEPPTPFILVTLHVTRHNLHLIRKLPANIRYARPLTSLGKSKTNSHGPLPRLYFSLSCHRLPSTRRCCISVSGSGIGNIGVLLSTRFTSHYNSTDKADRSTQSSSGPHCRCRNRPRLEIPTRLEPFSSSRRSGGPHEPTRLDSTIRRNCHSSAPCIKSPTAPRRRPRPRRGLRMRRTTPARWCGVKELSGDAT